MTLECFALFGDIDPQTALSTDRAGTLDDESEHISLVARRW
jgi:hypothetical protein